MPEKRIRELTKKKSVEMQGKKRAEAPDKRRVKDIASLMLKDWKLLLMMVAFDLLCLLLLSKLEFVYTGFGNMLPNITELRLAHLILPAISLFFLVILAYSFFKYIIIRLIKEGFAKKEFGLRRFFYFFALNLIVAVLLAIVFAALFYLAMAYFGKMYSGEIGLFGLIAVFLVIGAASFAIFIYLYASVNIMHFSFLSEKNLRKLIKGSLINPFNPANRQLYWNNLKIIFVAGLSLLILHFALKLFVFDDFSLYMKYYSSYRLFALSTIILTIYFIVLFNRFGWYLNMSEMEHF